jgi:hypothetical protein
MKNSSLRLHVTGGRQRGLRPLTAGLDWYEYEAALAVEVDPTTGDTTPVHEHVSPPEATPDGGGTVLFKSGTLRGERLWTCTQTEVMIYRLPSWQRETYLSLPVFNDLHHVLPLDDGKMLVAASGLDMVFEIATDGEVTRSWDVTGRDLWHRFSPDKDYRKVPTTKPHASHPNFVFAIGPELWATRFEQRDAVSLTEPGRRIDIGTERVHDGVVFGDTIFFTTVNGGLVLVDAPTLKVRQTIDLTAMHPPDMLLGWTRGLYVVDETTVWVGFSRIRPTKFRENLGWLARGFKRDFGTHVGLYDLDRMENLAQISVEGAGLSAVFGIFPVGASR